MNYLFLIIIIYFIPLLFTSSTTTKEKQKGKNVLKHNIERSEEQNEGSDTTNKKRRGAKPGGNKLLKVAVIGGEIIAALFKYHMNEINKTVIVDIFKHEFQNGNDSLFIIHERQKLMMNTVQELSLTYHDLYPNNNTPVIYDGVENYRQTHKPNNPDFRNFIRKSMGEFQHAYYVLGNKAKPVETLQQLILKIHCSFENLLTVRTTEICDKNWFKRRRKLKNFVKSSILINYNQNYWHVNAFAGLFVLTYSELTGQSFRITDSFQTIFEKLTTTGPGKILKGKVLKVTEGTYHHVVSWKDENGKIANDLYDYVVIATSDIDDIDFTSFRDLIKICKHRKFILTIVNGKLKTNSSLSNRYPNLNVVTDIINVKNNKFKLAKKIKTDKWKFISDIKLDNSDLNDLFEIVNFESSEENYILYPDFSDMDCILKLKFDLGNRLYNVNIVEWASNLLEMKAIGARNVALSIQRTQKLTGNYKNQVMYQGKKPKKYDSMSQTEVQLP